MPGGARETTFFAPLLDWHIEKNSKDFIFTYKKLNGLGSSPSLRLWLYDSIIIDWCSYFLCFLEVNCRLIIPMCYMP